MNIQDSLSKQLKYLKNDKVINWYMCGPTVYDHAHLGHARNYITNDILIRILHFLGYQVCLNMNITDIDDKIIKKAIEKYKDDYNINSWKNIAELYEKSFITNMIQLNVKMPDMLTRVSDYIHEIIKFIEILIEKKYAYKSQVSSSVYFDSQNFYEDFTDGFDVPANCDELEENNNILQEKKNARDFALWKAVKIVKIEDKEYSEPFWESPWGNGRPGWHIECSAMSHSIFGENLTIHSGGIDLKFPHHENERKQCVAHNSNNNWVDIFIHIGHLHIDGLKMSKSLKNFITINNIIEKYDSNTLRMFCLMHKYSDNVDYNEEHMNQVLLAVKQIENFLSRTEYYVKDETQKLSYQKTTEGEKKTIQSINVLKHEIMENLKNDFDTPSMINKIFTLIDIANVNNKNYNISLNIFEYIYDITKMLGFNFEKKQNNFEFIKVMENFRNEIRNYAKTNKQSNLYKLTDNIRTEISKKFCVDLTDK
jgi:cysteinyl-tRNA synthetase